MSMFISYYQWLSEKKVFCIKLSQMSFTACGIYSWIIVNFQFVSCISVVFIEFLFLICIHGRDCKDDFLNFKFPQFTEGCFVFRPYRDPLDLTSYLFFIDINKTSWYVRSFFIIKKFFCEADAYTSCSDNGDLDLLNFLFITCL